MQPDAARAWLVKRLRAKHEVSLAKRMPAQPSSSLPKRREPGVSFGLSTAEYNADPSPGSVDLKRLRQPPARETLQLETLHDPKLVTDPGDRLHRLIDGHVCALNRPNCGHADGPDCGQERRSAQEVQSAGRPVSHLTKLARRLLMPRDDSPPTNGGQPGVQNRAGLNCGEFAEGPTPPPPLVKSAPTRSYLRLGRVLCRLA